MFDVLVFLYENYWRPDACPEAPQLRRKLSAVGFEHEEIQEALMWLDGLATHTQQATAESPQGWAEQSALGQRYYTAEEREALGEDSLAFISFLESAGVLPAPMREVVIDRAMAAGDTPLDLDDLKVIVLMVFWSLGEEPDALILDELSLAAEDRQLH